MAVNDSRSMNAELAEGMSDGKYKKVRPNVSGGEPATAADRTNLSDVYYGVHEASEKVLPDGTTHATPAYVPTAPFRLT